MRTAPAAPASGAGTGSSRDAGAPSAAPDMDAPAGRISAPVPLYKRSADESPACTAYRNASEAEAEPDAYTALAGPAPVGRSTDSASSGAPETDTSRENWIVMFTDEPAAYVPGRAHTDTTDGAGRPARPSEARTTRSGASGEDGTAYTSGPACPAAAGGARARTAMPWPPPPPPPSNTGTAATSRSREAS